MNPDTTLSLRDSTQITFQVSTQEIETELNESCVISKKVLKTKEATSKYFEGNDDFGHILHKDSIKAVFPESLEDLQKWVFTAYESKIPLTIRGEGHSTYGQSQIQDGILLYLSKFNHIAEPQGDSITVGCGAKLKNVLKKALESGLTLPILTDYLGLSVGGVLSVGGLGGQINRHGTVSDNVLSLKVMTLDGKVHHCSRTENSELFHASLTTLGQFTIILEATFKLIPAPKNCQVNLLYYDDLKTYMEDQTYLLKNKVFNYQEGQIVKVGTNPQLDEKLTKVTEKDWCYMIEGVSYQYDSETTSPDLASLKPILTTNEEKTYKDFANRMKPTVKFLKEQGSWHQQHPWFDAFISTEKVYGIVNEIMKTFSVEDTGGWPVLFYPIDKSNLSCTYFKTPESESNTFWLLCLLRNSPNEETTQKLIQKNRELFDIITEAGGKMYPVGAIPLKKADWKVHYGNQWSSFKKLKDKYDPFCLLARGQRIF